MVGFAGFVDFPEIGLIPVAYQKIWGKYLCIVSAQLINGLFVGRDRRGLEFCQNKRVPVPVMENKVGSVMQ
jgi:hypothetical protein